MEQYIIVKWGPTQRIGELRLGTCSGGRLGGAE